MEPKGGGTSQVPHQLPLGVVLLDLDEHDLPSVVSCVIDQMVVEGQVPPGQGDATVESFQLNHQLQAGRPQQVIRRPNRSTNSLADENVNEEPLNRRTSLRKSFTKIMQIGPVNSIRNYKNFDDSNQLTGNHQNGHIEIELENEKNSSADLTQLHQKYPDGTEATTVLVGSVDYLRSPTVAFVRLAQGLSIENISEASMPVRFVYMILGSFQSEKDYISLGDSISKLMSDKTFHEVAYSAKTREELLAGIKNFSKTLGKHQNGIDNNSFVDNEQINKERTDIINDDSLQMQSISRLAMQENPDNKRDPLVRVGRPFHGLIHDVKIRYSQYWSDVRDGLNLQVLSASIFIFFAALSPAITFGGMYSDQTNRFIGVGETLLVSSINGMIFALFAAQPLLIVGATGPLMIFDMSLLQFTTSMDLDFLSIRVWVGIWILIIGLTVAAFEAVTIVKKFTKFTEEIFSTFVCIIFIYGAFDKLAAIFRMHPLASSSASCYRDLNNTRILYGLLVNGSLYNGTNEQGTEVGEGDVRVNEPNTALLSMCLMIGTFLIAWKLKKFRNSRFLSRSIRRALGDFGVPIAIFLMVLLDFLIRDTYTDKLAMPKGLSPSNAEIRGWFINPLGVTKPLPVWCIIAACPAALLLFILIFLEENICHLILSKPERGLKKGTGFHLDIVVSCLINTISGFLGAPFMGPACVRTIAHMSALTIMGSTSNGEPPKVIGCHEQRLSGFVVSLLVGLSVMLYAVLNHVPNAVLYGIFLYMGVSATAGIQLLERAVLYFMPVKYHSDAPYVKNVLTWKMHVFTAIQLVLLGILWAVKQSPAALAVPFVLICLIPLRLYILPYIFTSEELIALDGADAHTPEEVAEEEADFYETAHALPTQIDDAHTHQHYRHHHSS